MSTAAMPNVRIALIAFSSLGDGLIYMMMAENLRLNGFAVTYFGNIGYQLRAWLPQIEIRPYPGPDEMEAVLAGFDLVIMSPPQFLRDRMDTETTEEMRRKWLLICQKCPSNWRYDHTDLIKSKCSADVFAALRGLLDCSGPIRFREFTDESVVSITLEYMRHKMHLREVNKQVSLSPPVGLQHRRHRRRIVVSPDSAWAEKKNWPPRAFLRLCRALKARGYDPKIVVAPANHARWEKRGGKNFETPQFSDVGQLSAYIYESGAVIANDSGNGHLASFLGVPVVTIYRKQNPLFHWRPDWGPGKVVCPRLTLPWFKGRIWKLFIRSSDIIAALEALP